MTSARAVDQTLVLTLRHKPPFFSTLLGFTPLPSAHPVQLEERSVSTTGYDAMLHLAWPGRTETIGFVKVGAGYKWVCDQEIHEGPLEFDTPDGRFHESITLNYSVPDDTSTIRRDNGMPPGFMAIYTGPNEALRMATAKNFATDEASGIPAAQQLSIVLPELKKWRSIGK